MRDPFLEYMPDDYEYPEPSTMPLVTRACEACGEPNHGGRSFSYISSTFLNGWINYVDIVMAYLVTRYRKHSENVEDLKNWVHNPPFHADLGEGFQDDIHILARGKDRAWWWFWYDRDCSDCVIGRFVTTDHEGEVIAKFSAYVNARHGANVEDGDTEGGDSGPPQTIPADTIRGWVKG